MPSVGPLELIVVLVLALIVLGPKRLPAAGRSLGRGMREFKQGLTTSASADEGDAVAASTPASVSASAVEPASRSAG